MKQLLFSLICVLSITVSASKESLKLHVPSPDWRDQIIYFLMVDRFNDGDTSNNDQGLGVYSASDNKYFNGGDLQGVIDKTDYIKELGATAVWITPPVANLWWSPGTQLAGYHGYWARDFKSIDEHLGTLDTYKSLSDRLHQNGMYLIQDIVTNHVGRYFTYDFPYDSSDTSTNFRLIQNIIPSPAPTQYPFNLNDRNNPQHHSESIYHWTPEIINYSDTIQEASYQTAGLNDLNTSNPKVRDALKDAYGYWINEVGVDAFRLDTAKYVEHDFLHDFLYGSNGIISTAAKTGRESFPIFGEVFETSPAFSDDGEQKIVSFLGTELKPELNTAIGFPLYEEINRVFAQGSPTSNMTYRLNKQMEVYKDPYLIANFVDNHDVPRFLTKGEMGGFKQALALIMTVPGIPVIYQGDEQAFEKTRRSMFKGGYASTEDQFDTHSEMFIYIQKLTKLRKENKIFSRGRIEVIKDNESGPGIFAYQREYQNKIAFVIFNSANNSTLLSKLTTGLTPNQPISMLFSEKFSDQITLDENGDINIELPARSIIIFMANKADVEKSTSTIEPAKNTIIVNQTVDNWVINKTTNITGTVTGKVSNNVNLLLVIDGNLDTASKIKTDQQGNWQGVLEVDGLGTKKHYFEIYSKHLKIVSDQTNYLTKVTNAEIEFTATDPLADDHGPTGTYLKPSTEGFDNQMDIEAVTIRTTGKNLQLIIKMNQLTSHWVAANGFDHVLFHVYFDLSDREGLTELPLLQSTAPENFNWDLEHVFFGWGNKLYSNQGASKNQRGKGLALTPSLTVDKSTRTITILYEGDSLDVSNWKGSKVYITSWDGDGEGNHRNLTPAGGEWEFGGADSTASHILDDIGPIEVKQPTKPFTNNAMAPLDMKNDIKQWDDFRRQILTAKQIGIDAISVDVWWGMVERSADNKFDWRYYDKVFDEIEKAELHWVPIMSFHRCGGYIGDVCNARIPKWLWGKYKHLGVTEEDMHYKGENDVLNNEAVSLWSDGLVIEQYIEFMDAFEEHFASKASIIDEINISMGASGELRYPAYSPQGSICDYPSRGCFQAYSQPARNDFIRFVKIKYDTLEQLNNAWKSNYNSFTQVSPPDDGTPKDGRASSFVTSGEYKNSQYGRDFIDWYHESLVEHGRRMLNAGITAFDGAFANIEIGLKIAGIHWQMSPKAPAPRITEMAVGLIPSSVDVANRETGYGYKRLMQMIAGFKHKYPVALHFTNLEGDDRDIENERNVFSQARTQLNYVARAANDSGITLKGENAMAVGVENEHGWDNINRSVSENTFHGLTVLRVENVTDNPIGKKRYQQFIETSK